jgi:hypothetical protein
MMKNCIFKIICFFEDKRFSRKKKTLNSVLWNFNEPSDVSQKINYACRAQEKITFLIY